MKHVRVSLDASGREGEIHPMYDLLSNAEFVEHATLTDWTYSGEELGVMQYVEGDIDRFQRALAEISVVREYELTRVSDRSCYAYVRDATTPQLAELLETIERSPVVVVSPIEYGPDSGPICSMYGPSEAIQWLIEQLPAPIEPTVDQIGGMASIPGLLESVLSDRQREAVEAALNVGYYEIPREASQEDVAERIGCSPSTAAEHLQKAETTLLKTILK